MVLKKPSEYFKKDIPSVDNSIQEAVKLPELNTFSDAFQSFKNNLSKIEVLSDFSETLDNYRVNVERVNHLSLNVEDIKNEIQSLLKKEDLDRAMMAQLFIVEQSIQDVQKKVKGINENNLTEIRLDVAGLTENISEFLEIEVPKYKKIIVDSELRTNARYEKLEENVNKTFEGIGEFVDNKYQQLTESLEGINEKSLSAIIEDFKLLESNIEKLKEEDIPKYKGFIVETEKKVDTKLEKVDERFDEKISQIEASLDKFDEATEKKIQDIQTSLNEFINIESPKYSKLLIENKLKTEEEVKILQENISEKVSQFVQDIDALKNSALKESQDINTFVTEKIDQFKQTLSETQKDVKKTLSTYTSISRTFEDKITSDNERIDICENTLNQVSQKIEDCLSQILVFKEDVGIQKEIENEWKETLKKEISNTLNDYHNVFGEEIGSVHESLNKKVSDLQLEIVRNETHIKVQNKNLNQIQEEVKDTLSKINLEEIEKQNYKLGEKIKYLEEIFKKFSEKDILTENIIVEPPSTDNKDPLTPLDQKFVTVEQLQEHYRLFINRIQQQLATIGGGGETQLKYLDDIVGIATNASAYDGKYLKYNHQSKTFEFSTVTIENLDITNDAWVDGSDGPYTLGKVGIGTTAIESGTYPGNNLVVYGNARITGTLSIGTSTITLNPNEDKIQIGDNITFDAANSVITVGDAITLDAANNLVSIGDAITFDSLTGSIDVQGSTIASASGDASYTGIMSASAFVGDGSGLTGIVSAYSSQISDYALDAAYAAISGISSYANEAGYAAISGISSYANEAGYAAISGISSYTNEAGYAAISGIASAISGDSVSVVSLEVSGVSTLGNIEISSGIITSISGIITYYGDGSKLSGVVSESGITISSSGSIVGTSITTLNFEGNSVTVSSSSGISTVTINSTGGGGGGSQGAQGLQGVQGLQGSSGSPGDVGSQGSQGSQGLQGTIGSQGLQGVQGLQGLQGSPGDVGSQGSQGLQGTIGSQGLQGVQGLQGSSGSPGDVGSQGSQGLQGTIGSQGLQGVQGLQGLQGVQGLSNQGIQGVQGPSGGGGGGSVTIKDEGSILGTAVTSINFVGSGVVATGDNAEVTVTISGGGNSTTRTTSRIIATENQTLFTVDYTVGYVDVYLNGSKLDSSEYTATNGTTITLTEGASVNDCLEFVAYSSISLSGTTVIDDNSTNTTRYIALTDAISGGISSIRVASTELTFNPGTNTFTTGNLNSSNLNVTGVSTLGTVSNLNVSGICTISTLIPTQTRIQSVAEKIVRIDGNTASINFTTSGSNIGLCTNPTGNITLNVTGIPTDSSFDNHSILFSVVVMQTGTARTCTAVTLNGVSRPIKWFGGSLGSAISGVTTTIGYDLYNFTGINTVGSASTTTNYEVLGVVNGGFR